MPIPEQRLRRWLCWLLGPCLAWLGQASPADIRWRSGGHFIGVESVEFLPGGQRLISATADVDVKLWDLASRRPIWTSSDGRFGSTGAAVARDGSFYLASATERGSNFIARRLSEGFPTTPFGPLRTPAYAMAVSPSGQRAAAAGYVNSGVLDRDLRVWQIATGTEIAALPVDALPDFFYVAHLQFLTEDDLLIGSDRVTRWSIDGTIRWAFAAGTGTNIYVLAVTPDRSRILVQQESIGGEGALQLLDSATGSALWTMAESVTAWRGRFGADGSRFVLGFSNRPAGQGRVEVRATTDGSLLRTVPADFLSPVPALSPDGQWLACGHFQGIHLASLSGELNWEPLTESWGQIRDVAVSSAQNWMASAHSSLVTLRRLDTGTRFQVVETGNPVSALAAASDGSWLAFTTNGTSLVRYYPATDNFDTHSLETGAVSRLSVSADGSRLVAVPQQGDAWIIDPVTWTVMARPKARDAESVSWARDASRLTFRFASGQIETYARDTTEPQFSRDWQLDKITFMEYLADGETILSLHRSGWLRRWRVTDGAVLTENDTGLTNRFVAALSPDQKLLLVSGQGDGIRVLDASSGVVLDRRIEETGFQSWKLQVSADGAYLVNARFDGVVVASGAPFLLRTLQARPEGIGFSVSGGGGSYQLQRHPSDSGNWTDVGTPFTGSEGLAPYDGSGPWLFRLLSVP